MREFVFLIILGLLLLLIAAFYAIYWKNKDIRCREYILQKFAESVRAAFFIYNITDGKIEYAFKGNEKYFGKSEKKLKQNIKSFYELFAEKEADQIREMLKAEQLQEEKEFILSCSNMGNGEKRDFAFSVVSIEEKKQKKRCIIKIAPVLKERLPKRPESKKTEFISYKKVRKPIRYDLSGKRFLVVENNGISIKIIKKMLEGSGALVEVVKTGEEAVSLFQDKEAGYFQVVMMDIELPNADGFDTTARIRKLDKEDAKTIPIFALTAGSIEENAEKAVRSGMSFYLEKPLDIELLCKTLERM